VIVDRDLLRGLAEDALAPPPPPGSSSSRVVGDGYIVEIGPDPSPDLNIALRLRLEGRDVEATVIEVRQLFEQAGRRAATWEVSSGSTPSGLEQELRAVGMQTNETAAMLALACTAEPASATPAVTVERVESDDQFRQVREIFERSDGWTPSEDWLRGGGHVTRYLARIEQQPVATADITWLEDERAAFLGGALTLPQYRGRGAYRALVHARWRDAVAAGRSLLVTQSEPMSQPILMRLGFEVVGHISVLVDRW
jgi:GNAT superfamily N-acetyltransferase